MKVYLEAVFLTNSQTKGVLVKKVNDTVKNQFKATEKKYRTLINND